MIGYRKKVRRDVQQELLGHFADALRDCASAEETQAKAERLIAEFGDPQLLAILCRRATKRCRPLWLRAIGGTRTAIFLLVTVLSSYTAWFVSGKPVVTDEYIVKLNEISRPEAPVTDNAWPLYEKALSLVVEPSNALKEMPVFNSNQASDFDEFADLSEEEQKLIIGWVAQNEAAWAQFERASRKTHHFQTYRCPTSISDPSSWLFLLKPAYPLSGVRTLARVAVWKSRFETGRGHKREALERCLTLARAGAHWQSSVVVNEWLLGMACSALAYNEIVRIIRDHDLPAMTLEDLQIRLIEAYPNGHPPFDCEGERLMVLDAVQRMFTSGGFGGGHLIPGGYSGLRAENLDELKTWRFRMILRPVDIGISMIHARRDKTVAKVHQVFDEIRKRSKLSPYQRWMCHIGGWEEMAASLNRYRYGLIYLLLPNESLFAELRSRAQVQHEAILAILAVKRYHCATGDYPVALEELVKGGYLGSVPMDPFSDGPLLYRAADEDFLLYSVGRDFIDGGGTRGVDNEGKPRLWAENGDQIFWPLTKPQ
ncbi:MAG: hypothetical protein JSW27_06220 [Phycisphaerales bacterium]|nr:MAG: hypothetical protein JSW27_06220 [Phycisphaerales bacterium]